MASDSAGDLAGRDPVRPRNPYSVPSAVVTTMVSMANMPPSRVDRSGPRKQPHSSDRTFTLASWSG
jgi:hypothetical protein